MIFTIWIDSKLRVEACGSRPFSLTLPPKGERYSLGGAWDER